MNNKPSKILMVRPSQFGYNSQTETTNSFQKNDNKFTSEEIQKKALNEFDGFVALLKSNEIDVKVVQDSPIPHTPDSIFPNNIFSSHENNTFIFYPMMAENRRLEKDKEYMKYIEDKSRRYIDYTFSEGINQFIEGTGSIVFDYENNISYASISPRTNKEMFLHISQYLNYKPLFFSSSDKNGKEIYHTNVMMCIGKGFALLCDESITDKQDLHSIRNSLTETNHEIISIDYNQLNSFAGNSYQLYNKRGESFIVMSEQAFNSLRKAQIDKLNEFGKILHSPLYTIENYGGGSARCMIADIRC